MPSDLPESRREQDPFALLGLQPRFDLDTASIRRAWLAATRELHPDRAGARPEAAEMLARINHAKRTLEDPEERASALLRLLGGPTKEQDKTLPDGYLMEMLEIREQMESEIAQEHDDARTRWESWSAQRRQQHIDRAAAMFSALGPAPDSGELRAIRLELNAWRYVERLIEQLDPAYKPGPS